MGEQEILAHVEQYRLPNDGIEYVRQALAAPSRIVGCTRFLSVGARFASQKLGQVIQAESHTSELPFIHLQELDDQVVACLDQPPPLHVESVDKRGRIHRTKKTPDFLVIRRQGVYLYECKTRGDLERFLQDGSGNWVHDEDGYHYLPCEKAAAALGIPFRVHDAGTICPIHASNLGMLVNVQRARVPPMEERVLKKAMRLLIQNHGMSISTLATELELDSITPILAGILHKQLYAPIRWQLLSKSESAVVYATENYLKTAEEALSIAASINCLREENYLAPIALSKSALDRAIENTKRIQSIRSGEIKPNRSDYRHLKTLKLCEARGDSPLLALAPKYHLRGSAEGLPEAIEKIVGEVIRTLYASSLRPRVTAVHRLILVRLAEMRLSPISYETVRQRIINFSRVSLAQSREGYRSANAIMPPIPVISRAIPADRAWQKAHVDSTVLDEKIWLALDLGGVLSRPTIYLLVDEGTSYILAYWICFGNAGDQAVACLFRDCLRRHQKLPNMIVHDRGSEYFSIYAENFTASTGIDLLRRPRGAPRWGSHVEAAFNRINQLVIHQLPGNTQNDRLGRSSMKEMRSAVHARLDLYTFTEILEESLMGWLNNRPLEGRLTSPREEFEHSERQFAGLVKEFVLNPELLANTAIPAQKLRRIDHAHGIKYRCRRYIGPGIKCPSLHGKKVPIRWEPYDPNIIYAQVKGAWERLTCRGYVEHENVDLSHKFVEIHMRANISGAAKAIRQSVDHVMAVKLNEKLATSVPPAPHKIDRTSRQPSGDLFAQARNRILDSSDELLHFDGPVEDDA